MVLRKIILINEELCNGCGNCIPKCVEGALQIIDGKAKIVKDIYCDGLGACLGHCPQGALSVVEREADPFDQKAVHDLSKSESNASEIDKIGQRSAPGRQWPIKLSLVPLVATFYDDADLLVTADCVPVAYPAFHDSLLKGKAILIGCPKFDDVTAHIQKLAEILKRNNVKSITIAHMEVPCCSGLKWMVDRAVEAAGRQIPVRRHIITIKGEMR